jgi:hypothetical protein
MRISYEFDGMKWSGLWVSICLAAYFVGLYSEKIGLSVVSMMLAMMFLFLYGLTDK